jgi:hypothetical protein
MIALQVIESGRETFQDENKSEVYKALCVSRLHDLLNRRGLHRESYINSIDSTAKTFPSALRSTNLIQR